MTNCQNYYIRQNYTRPWANIYKNPNKKLNPVYKILCAGFLICQYIKKVVKKPKKEVNMFKITEKLLTQCVYFVKIAQHFEFGVLIFSCSEGAKMAAKGNRNKITLACTECKQRNYDTFKNKKNDTERLEMQKYCKFCKKHTTHKEAK